MSPPDRRAVLAGLGCLCAGGLKAQPVAPDDPRLRTASVRQTVSPGRTLAMYLALPAKAHGRQPAVLVTHDAAGLDEAAREAAREVALMGYVACAPDFLSRLSGTPADAAAARIMMARLDPIETLHDATGAAQWLGRNPPGERVLTGRVGAVGLGWGAALVERLAAVESALAVAIAVGAPPPVSPPLAAAAPMLRLDAPDWPRAAAFLQEHLR